MQQAQRWQYSSVGWCLGLLILLTLPLWAEVFYIRFTTRVMIYAMVACSLDFILGYGGMVSFGHAAFFGVGAYAVAILGAHGITNGFLVWPIGVIAATLAAGLIGSISLRTRGVYFIMITLAFAQMLYYCAVSLQAYGGDDGLAVARSTFGGLLHINRHTTLYYVVLVLLGLVLGLGWRVIHSRFGLVLRGIHANERRMQALGYATTVYKFVAFSIAGAVAGLAGVLVANHTGYISPALLHWTRSGEIMVMVILGGMGSLVGPVLGAAALLLAEEVLSSYTEHWMLLLGPLLLLVVVFAKGGLYSVLTRARQQGETLS